MVSVFCLQETELQSNYNMEQAEAKKIVSRMAKVLGSLGGSVRNKNRSKESYSEAGKKGMAKRWEGHKKQGETL